MTIRKKSKSFVFDDVQIDVGILSEEEFMQRYSQRFMASQQQQQSTNPSSTYHQCSNGANCAALHLGEAFQAGISAATKKATTNRTSSSSRRTDSGRVQRPDRHPFILDTPGSVFFPSRSMPKACTKHPVVIGESFWKLVAYLDSVPSRLEERYDSKPPHVLLNGLERNGKSMLMAATAHILSATSRRMLSINGDDWNTVLIGDCRRWLESEDPLQYFRMELLAAFRNEPFYGDHTSPTHLGCLVCVEPFTRLEQVNLFIQHCCNWLRKQRPDTWFVVFIDQVEEIIGRPDSVPFKIVEMLVAAKFPICVFSQKLPSPTGQFPWPVGTTLTLPFRLPQAEFNLLMDSLTSPEERLWGREMSLWKDIRLWTGGHPGETAHLTRMPLGVGDASMAKASPDSNQAVTSYLHRIALYSRAVTSKTFQLISGRNLQPKQRNTLIIALFAMILRVPLDWSEKFNVKELKELDPAISSLLHTDCLQSFYHPTDGTVSVRSIPTAIGYAQHLALMSPSLLACLAKSWEDLFETVVNAMLNSKQLCAEAKRRFARFYLHAKLIWSRCSVASSNVWRFQGRNELGEEFTIRLSKPRVIIFAGQIPSLYHFMSSGMLAGNKADPSNPVDALLTPDFPIDPLSQSSNEASSEPFDSVIFLPGRTSYLFFDAFILVPADKRLYAISTAPVVGTWLKELSLRVSPSQLQAHRDEGLLTPLILLENWKEALRKAGLPKVSTKLCLMKASDLMLAAGSTSDTSAATTELAKQFEKAASIKEDDIILPEQ